MIWKKVLAIALLSVVVTGAGAQQRRSALMEQFLQEVPQRAAFNTHAYEFPILKDTPAPKGYKPFYISHYGRHGARSSWGRGCYDNVIGTLTAAREAGILTPDGETLLQETQYILDNYDGMDGRLTPRGVKEHEALAQRMYQRYPAVFRKGSRKIRAVSSTVPRCIVSMTAATGELLRQQKSLDISWDTGERFMDYIARADNAEINKRVAELLAPVNQSYTPDTVAVLHTLFTDPQAARALMPSALWLEENIFWTAIIADAFDIQDNMFRYIPFDAVYKFHELTILSAYLGQCNSVELGDLRMPRAEKLARVIAEEADAAIANGYPAANLRYGHDWPFLGIVSYFGLEGVGDRMTLDEARERWLGARYCSFAANLQMIFYRNKAGDVLVKFLLNEVETAIPALQPVAGPYYRWADVKAAHGLDKPITE